MDADLEESLLKFRALLEIARASIKLEDRLPGNLIRCSVCGDTYTRNEAILTKEYCVDCYIEKNFGVIPGIEDVFG